MVLANPFQDVCHTTALGVVLHSNSHDALAYVFLTRNFYEELANAQSAETAMLKDSLASRRVMAKMPANLDADLKQSALD